MNQKLLSICIPTYNRAGYLKECLDSIVCQFEEISIYSQIEVVISDNASPDNTGEIIKIYQKKFDNIKYFRNTVNIGFDGNVINVIQKATGRYCWLFGDDDIFEKNSLGTIINLISKYKSVVYIYVNAARYDPDMQYLNKLVVKDREIIHITSADDFILNYDLPGLISSQIFIKHLWDSTEKNKYKDNFWMHTSVILEFLGKNSDILYVGDPLIKMRQSKWSIDMGHSFKTFISLKRIITNLLYYNYKKESIDELNRKFAKALPFNIIMAKINNLKFRKEDLSSIYYNFNFSPLFCFLSLLIYCMPNSAFKGIAFLKIKIDKLRL